MTMLLLEATKEFPRRLLVDKLPSGYHISVRSPDRNVSLGFCSCAHRDLSIYRNEQQDHYLVAGAQFPITQDEAEKICSIFDLEVES